MAGNAFNRWRGVLRSILMYYYKPFNRRRLQRFYQAFVSPGALCFDIGAHLGNRTDAWLALGARVVALEPQPACITFLKKKWANHPQFTLLPVAAGAQSGTAALQVSERTPTVSTLSPDKSWQQQLADKSRVAVSWDYEIPVEVVTLDQLIKNYGIPDFCKIDVEDFEVEVLKGLSQPVPALSFEYFAYTPHRTFACMDELARIGTYVYNWSYGESQRWASEQWVSDETLRAIFRTFGPDHRHGDVYARLQS
ncbi:MAG: FkbM family methyltransferase [Bacteroidia bacterium]|nr:FkbM family methyltransferase [Bacteroidia bacterium]